MSPATHELIAQSLDRLFLGNSKSIFPNARVLDRGHKLIQRQGTLTCLIKGRDCLNKGAACFVHHGLGLFPSRKPPWRPRDKMILITTILTALAANRQVIVFTNLCNTDSDPPLQRGGGSQPALAKAEQPVCAQTGLLSCHW